MEEQKQPKIFSKADFVIRTFKGVSMFFWGILLIYIPPLFGITGLWKIPSYIFAVILINIAFLIVMEQPGRLNIEPFTKWDTNGIFAAGCFWLWSVIFTYTTAYFNITGILKIIFFVLSILSLVVSFAGSSIELGKRKKQADDVTFWKPGLPAVLPGIAICLSLIWLEFDRMWNLIAMFIALGSLALGGGLLITAVIHKSFYANWLIFRIKSRELSKKPPEEQSEILDAGPIADINTIVYRTISLLAIATAVVIIILNFK